MTYYMQKLTLFQFENCPYCIKVRKKLEELKIPYEKIEVPRDREADIRKEIAEKSGVLTVPVVKIRDFYLGESEDIIRYIKENPEKFK